MLCVAQALKSCVQENAHTDHALLMQSNFGALDFELTEEEMQNLSSIKFQKRLVDGSMVRCLHAAPPSDGASP